MMVITPKHVGDVLMQILILLLEQFYCASAGEKKNFDNIKMQDTTVKIDIYNEKQCFLYHKNWNLPRISINVKLNL